MDIKNQRVSLGSVSIPHSLPGRASVPQMLALLGRASSPLLLQTGRYRKRASALLCPSSLTFHTNQVNLA